MLSKLALVAFFVVLALAGFLVARALALNSARVRKRRRIFLGPAAVAGARVGDVVPVGRRGKQLRIAHVDPRGVLTVEPAPPPPAAAKRGAATEEQALLRALGFDPKTHDLQPVLGPWKGVQVLKDGERVRFFTEKQVRARLNTGAWDAALREARA